MATRLALDTVRSDMNRTAVLPAAINYALQPIVDVHSGIVYAYEALVRGTAEAGHASIDAFFDDAHRTGRLLETELALYEQALATFRRLPHDDAKKLFLNVDGRLFGHRDFAPADIGRIVDRMGVPRSSLCLELSEKQNIAAGEVISALRSEGLRIAVDDFGQGFSELKLLYEASPDYVKIDRFFIQNIAAMPRKRLFVSTVVDLAHVLGARVIAEGVETEEEFLACREIGCDLAQGWYLSRPIRDVAAAPNVYLAARDPAATDIAEDPDGALSGEMERARPLHVDTPLLDVFDRLRDHPDQSLLPVVDDNDEPLGLVRERDFRAFIYDAYGRDILVGRTLGHHLRDFMIRVPVVDVASDVEEILRSVASFHEADGVLVTRDMRYAGMLTSTTLLKLLHDRMLSVARDQNPLSNLPGNASLNGYLAATARSDDAERHYCYFDFNHFKPFNDTYGFRHGDRVIMLFADILRRRLAGQDTFLAHIGGDDFFAGRVGGDLAAFEQAAADALSDFRAEVESFYDPADRDRGYLRALDRQGREQIFPMMTCSAAVLVLPAGRGVESVESFARWMADGKRQAKLSPDGRRTVYIG